jgi:hypothetical protein
VITDTTEADLKSLRTLVVDCPELRQLEQQLGRFNIFEVLKLGHHEIRHSNVLAWLLNPDESHGFGDLFLRRWLMRVFHEAESDAPDLPDAVEIDSADLRTVEVRREWNHIDLLLIVSNPGGGRDWVFAVENKVGSSQHSDQLTRYREKVESTFPSARQGFIFLTVLNEEPEDDYYASATYAQIVTVLDECLAERQGLIADGPRLVICHYQELIRSRFMANSAVAELARKIYAAHSQALELIFEQRPDNLQRITDEIEQRLKSYSATNDLHMVLTSKGIVRFIPRSWLISSNLLGDDLPMVFCEINLRSNKLVFKALVGPEGSQDFRNNIAKVAIKEGFPNTVKKTKIPATWYSFYAIKGNELKLDEAEQDDLVALADTLWTWCEVQLKAMTFKTMHEAVRPILEEAPIA